MEVKTKKLKKELYKWYKANKREFSWRSSSNPWEIFLLETISQQTQLNRANEYYEVFVKAFPTPEIMSKTSYKRVLKLWSGLGYNNRAKRLHEASKIISNIFSFLDLTDLRNCTLVCKSWNRYLADENNDVWRFHCSRKLAEVAMKSNILSSVPTYKAKLRAFKNASVS